ncbi:Hypothetical predicted protein [Octopus vulgaris]|uniref:Uncharacterized protein n=1 Tax=Octopus vulgaris TaxID=6645 RepID=A0AA36EWZ6_OCTVU|nr:Hypothetical predicted protein [Octopus vulgaris]
MDSTSVRLERKSRILENAIVNGAGELAEFGLQFRLLETAMIELIKKKKEKKISKEDFSPGSGHQSISLVEHDKPCSDLWFTKYHDPKEVMSVQDTSLARDSNREV